MAGQRDSPVEQDPKSRYVRVSLAFSISAFVPGTLSSATVANNHAVPMHYVSV